MHPLDRLSKKVRYFGWYQRVLGRMRRSIQPLYGWVFVLLLTSCTNLLAPLPFKVSDKQYIYLDPKDPGALSLANSDPDTYRIKSKIDLSQRPDIIP
jgi:hypothetical protein